jgi:hypothetical protein
MTVARTRGFLYKLARFLGDYQAVKRGRIGKRIANKLLGRRRRPALVVVTPQDFPRTGFSEA